MNTTRRLTKIVLTLLTLLLAACGQNTTLTTSNNSSSVPNAAVSTSASPPISAAIESSAVPSSAPNPTEQPSPSAARTSSAPAPASSSALDAISAAYTASVAAKSYRVESTITSGSATTIVNTFEIMLPNRLHRTTNINGKTSELISIDATTYSRANSGEWVKSASASETLDLLKQIGADPATIGELTKHITDAKVVGPDTLDGKPMTVYQYMLTFNVNASDDQSSSVATMWVGADGLPYKLESAGSSNISGKTTTSHLVNIYSDYNADLNIVAPIS